MLRHLEIYDGPFIEPLYRKKKKYIPFTKKANFRNLRSIFASMQTCHTLAGTLLCRQCCEGSLPEKREEGRTLRKEKKTARLVTEQKEARQNKGVSIWRLLRLFDYFLHLTAVRRNKKMVCLLLISNVGGENVKRRLGQYLGGLEPETRKPAASCLFCIQVKRAPVT